VHAAIAGSPDAWAQVSASSTPERASIPASAAGIVAAISHAPADAAEKSREITANGKGQFDAYESPQVSQKDSENSTLLFRRHPIV